MKKWSYIILTFIIILVIFFIINHEPQQKNRYQNTNQDTNNLSNNAETNQNAEVSTNENCNVQFTEYLIDPKYVQKIGQIGIVHGSGLNIVERSYISIKKEFWGQEIPLYAPGDITLVAGAKYKMPGAPADFIPDYVLKFDAGCGVEIVLGHMKGVVDLIDDKIPNIQQDSLENYIRPIKFKAGELIGSYTQQEGNGYVGGFDFVMRDRNFKNQFLNQERYEYGMSDNLLTGVCPYDFYTGEKKTNYYNLFGGARGTLFKEKSCGNASRDKAGTISGMWFLDKEVKASIYDSYKEGDYGSPVSVVGDEESITIGHLGQSVMTRIYSNNPTYKLPTEITNEHCYQIQENSNANGYIYFKVIDNLTTEIYYSPTGNCPQSFPSSGSKTYYK